MINAYSFLCDLNSLLKLEPYPSLSIESLLAETVSSFVLLKMANLLAADLENENLIGQGKKIGYSSIQHYRLGVINTSFLLLRMTRLGNILKETQRHVGR